MDDIGRSLNGKMQIILIDNGNDNHKFDAIDNDFNYMDFGSFGMLINQMNSCFGHGLGTSLLQQQKQEQEPRGVVNKKWILLQIKKTIRVTIKIWIKISGKGIQQN